MKNNDNIMEVNKKTVKQLLREGIAYIYYDIPAEERALLIQNTFATTAKAIETVAANMEENQYNELFIRKKLIDLLFEARMGELMAE